MTLLERLESRNRYEMWQSKLGVYDLEERACSRGGRLYITFNNTCNFKIVGGSQ